MFNLYLCNNCSAVNAIYVQCFVLGCKRYRHSVSVGKRFLCSLPFHANFLKQTESLASNYGLNMNSMFIKMKGFLAPRN